MVFTPMSICSLLLLVKPLAVSELLQMPEVCCTVFSPVWFNSLVQVVKPLTGFRCCRCRRNAAAAAAAAASRRYPAAATVPGGCWLHAVLAVLL
jgi:hypothetical protein